MDANISKRKESWPFIWGTDKEPRQIIMHDRFYVFPEHETPELISPELIGKQSRNPEELGANEVVLTGREFIDELYRRGVLLEEIGVWSQRGSDRGTGRTTNVLQRAYHRMLRTGQDVFVVMASPDNWHHMKQLLHKHFGNVAAINNVDRRVSFRGTSGRMRFVSVESPMYHKESQRLLGEKCEDVFLDHTVVEQYAKDLSDWQKRDNAGVKNASSV